MFKRKKKWDKPFPEKIARRVAKLGNPDLNIWAEQLLFDLGRSLSNANRHQSDENLDQLSTEAEALHAIVYELNKRMTRRF
jgi:hypothetical protein